MSVEPERFREAMSRVPAPVAVVTTAGSHGEPYGFTASSLCALSLAPPLILVCLDRAMRSHDAFIAGTGFVVNILADDQQDLARLFATRGAGKFADPRVSWTQTTPPVVKDAVVVVSCQTHARYDGGDHTILVGAVMATTLGEGEPLVHVNRNFAVPAPLEASPAGVRAVNVVRAG